MITHRPTMGSFLSSGTYWTLHKIDILRRERGISEDLDLGLGGFRRFVVYAYYVEPPLARGFQLPQVLSYDDDDLAAFVTVDRRFRRLHSERRSGLDLDEAKYVFIPSDQIDLAPMLGERKFLATMT